MSDGLEKVGLLGHPRLFELADDSLHKQDTKAVLSQDATHSVVAVC